MAVEKPTNWNAIFALGILVLAAAIIYTGYKISTGQQIIIKQTPVPTPTAPTTQPQVKPPITTDTIKLYAYVKDAITGDKVTEGNVSLWLVDNLTEVQKRAFYASEGYTEWMSASLNSLGKASFEISAADYVANVLSDPDVKLYAVAIPNASVYYRNGVEVPSLPYNDTYGAFTKYYATVTIQVPKIAEIYDLNNFKIDFRGLKKDDTVNTTYEVLKVSSNDEGVFKIYKINVTFNTANLNNMTNFIDEMYIEVGGKKLDIIKDGEVKIDGSTADLEFPVIEVKPGESLSIKVYAKLSNDPDSSLDGAELGTISIIDVRDQEIGSVTASLDTQ